MHACRVCCNVVSQASNSRLLQDFFEQMQQSIVISPSPNSTPNPTLLQVLGLGLEEILHHHIPCTLIITVFLWGELSVVQEFLHPSVLLVIFKSTDGRAKGAKTSRSVSLCGFLTMPFNHLSPAIHIPGPLMYTSWDL